MEKIIKQKLLEIEKKENVKIIHAVESGSRAWGFASPDSDFDVRFLYVRPKENYLRLEKSRDVIEWQLDETLDINGWDLQKALRLLYKSNPTIFEWSNSPIIYLTTDYFIELKKIIMEYFSCKSGLYHYLNTAEGNYREFLKGEVVKLKKYFYVVRPILSCKWIISKGTPPPMLFSKLIETQLDDGMKPIIYQLLELKKNSPEFRTGKRIDNLNQYIEININHLKEYLKGMPKEKEKSWDTLNVFFLKALDY